MAEYTEQYECNKIYAFQCLFCFEKFDIAPRLEDRLLKHFYNLHAEIKTTEDIQDSEALIDEDYHNFIIEETDFTIDGQQSNSVDEFDLVDYVVLPDCRLQCKICSAIFKNWRKFEEHRENCCDPETVERVPEPAISNTDDFEHVEFLEDDSKEIKESEELDAQFKKTKIIEKLEPLDEDEDTEVEEDIDTEFEDTQSAEELDPEFKDTLSAEELDPEFKDTQILEEIDAEFIDMKESDNIETEVFDTKESDKLDFEVMDTKESGKTDIKFTDIRKSEKREVLSDITKYDGDKEDQLPKTVFRCEVCQKTFSRSSSLKLHIKRHANKGTHENHANVEEAKKKRRKLEDMDKCDFGLPIPGNPLMHWRCKSCNTMFLTRTALNAHFYRSHIKKIKKSE